MSTMLSAHGAVGPHMKPIRSDLRGETLYPSGRRVVTCADALLRPVWLSASRTMADCQQNVAVANGETYANGVQYSPHATVNQLTFGNGLLESANYNADLQPERMRLGSISGGSQACGKAGDAWCLELGYGAANANNGNLVSQGIFARKADGTGLAWGA